MKAVVLGSDSFAVHDVPSPVADVNQTHLTVLACALNHRDQYIREGKYSRIQLPAILGSDVCGITNDGVRVVVDASINWGSDARAQGKEYHILGMPSQGGLAEEVCVSTSNVYPAPDHLSNEEAACLPVAGVTAYRALFTRGQLQSGQTVLATGIGGGVATFTMLFASALGARVLASSRSQAKLDRAAEYGAEPVSMERDKGSVDLIIDSIGGDKLVEYLELIKPGGTIVSYGASAGIANNINLARVFWKQANILGSTMGTPRDFASMLEFVNRHQIRPVIDSVYALDQFNTAFERLRNADQFGKIVLRP